MNRVIAFFAFIGAAMLGTTAIAQDGQGAYGHARTVAVESWVEEWDPATGQWVRVSDADTAAISPEAALPVVTTTYVNGIAVSESRAAARYAVPTAPREPAPMLAQYGPFIVTSPTRASMIGSTDERTPAAFDAMLRDFPGLAVLELVEAPGTSNDIANLAVGRRIRAAGIATHVPRGGSVRSGAVELFLAGATRSVDDGAQFAVHAWVDAYGREPGDFAADHPANRLYLDYYVEMGMSEDRARAFYAMTNSVPHATALWLASDEMRGWLWPEPAAVEARFAAGEGTGLRALAELAHRIAARPMAATAMAGPEIDDAPAIGYTDVTGTGLAAIGAVHGNAWLDSGVALP